MLSVEFLYSAAANAGMLQKAFLESTEVMVDFRAPDEDVLSGMGVSRDYAIRYPLTWLPSLAAGNTLEISGQTYRVREITAIGDGSERRASLSKL
ncbi:hypothetical protein HZ993_07400 [Rhodoferax sp. AJA081-3]|nr:hypothetical protein HZ993_07400 [Rhodoferax sp. AJA081-3]